MRRRILAVALSAVGLAVLLLGAPLAVAIQSNAVAQARGELERAALQAAATVSPEYQTGDPVELPASDEIDIALYDASGARVTGRGPATLEAGLRPALDGSVTDGASGSSYLEAVPVSADESVIGVIRTASSRADVRAEVTRDLLALTALAVLALLVGGLLAYWQARRLSGPMQRLADAATDLGAGDFSVQPPVSGVPEIDRTGAALTATATRLSEQIERERSFAAHASHQLSTPLTRLRLELEGGLDGDPADLPAAAREALATAEELSRIVEEVLALARRATAPTESFDVEPILTAIVTQWSGTFASADRPLRLVVEDPPLASASGVAVRQILQVLLDNAFQHGAGEVTVTARESGGAVAIDVADRGSQTVVWPAADVTPQPLGLAMARSLAESQGGRLLLTSDDSGTCFTLLVPADEEATAGVTID
ncbi:MAG TPA: HAMP domain-containing sensor histidine kinase [Nocardioides sp.]|nr:HAMP domain-containing sensor histidine kinase [Nocardioides sp.]